jgi:hypothetical protein
MIRMLSMGALLLFAGGVAQAAPCTTAGAACTEMVGVPGSQGRTLVYRSYPLETKNAAITRALVVVHGLGRDADNYYRHALRRSDAAPIYLRSVCFANSTVA